MAAVLVLQIPFNAILPYPGNQEGKAAVTTSYGCMIAGNSPLGGSGDTQILLAGFDFHGNHLWVDSLHRGRSSNIISLDAVDGGYVLTGSMTIQESGVHAMALLLDEYGQVQWEHRSAVSNQHFTAACQGTDGTILCVGGTTSEGAGGFDVLMVALDQDGTELWWGTLGTEGEETSHHVSPCDDGGYIIAGLTMAWGAGWGDYWIIRTDSRGDTLWTATLGGPEFDYPWRVLQEGDCFVVAGSTLSFGAGSYDWWILKLDETGGLIWEAVWGHHGTDTCMALEVVDGQVYAAGNSEPEPGNHLQTIVVFGENGQVEQEWFFDTGMIRQITGLPQGGFLIGGSGVLQGEDLMAKTIDSQGNCPPLGIEESVAPSSITLFPNPAGYQVNLGISAESNGVRVYDLSGRLVLLSYPHGGLLDVSELTPGVYIVSDGVAPSAKLVLCR